MNWLKWASVVMFVGITLGAFGAHGLKHVLSTEMKPVYETAVFYHLIHGLALFGLAWLASQKPDEPLIPYAGFAFLMGVVLFSGSLYVLAISGVKKCGMITPFGGLSFLAGWLFIFLTSLRN